MYSLDQSVSSLQHPHNEIVPLSSQEQEDCPTTGPSKAKGWQRLWWPSNPHPQLSIKEPLAKSNNLLQVINQCECHNESRDLSVSFHSTRPCHQSCVIGADIYSSSLTGVCSGLWPMCTWSSNKWGTAACQFGKPLKCALPAPETQIMFYSHHSLISTESGQMLF